VIAAPLARKPATKPAQPSNKEILLTQDPRYAGAFAADQRAVADGKGAATRPVNE
jgi:hypothetical protein